MPYIDIPDHAHVNGMKKTAIHERVVAPTQNPSGKGSNQAPGGGELRSAPLAEPPSTISEKRKVLPQARQSARSVETLISSIAIADLHDGHMVFMKRQLCHSKRPHRAQIQVDNGIAVIQGAAIPAPARCGRILVLPCI